MFENTTATMHLSFSNRQNSLPDRSNSYVHPQPGQIISCLLVYLSTCCDREITRTNTNIPADCNPRLNKEEAKKKHRQQIAALTGKFWRNQILLDWLIDWLIPWCKLRDVGLSYLRATSWSCKAGGERWLWRPRPASRAPCLAISAPPHSKQTPYRKGQNKISRTLTHTGRILKFFNANTDVSVFGGRQSTFGRFRSALERCFFF